jgi:hypothetical protein
MTEEFFEDADFPQSGELETLPDVRGTTDVTVTGGVVSAQRVAVRRSIDDVKQRIKVCAARSASTYTYRIPFRKKGGGEEIVEGPTIKCAMDVAREYGNCQVESQVIDNGDAWIFQGKFCDIETGFTLIRSFQQHKGKNVGKGMKDPTRVLDQVFQIGCSKAIRNAVVNALPHLCGFAQFEAKRSVIDKIKSRRDYYIGKVKTRLGELDIKLGDVERFIGRTIDDWEPEDLMTVVSILQSIADGMTDKEDAFSTVIIDNDEPQSQPASSKKSEPKESKPKRGRGRPKKDAKKEEDRNKGVDNPNHDFPAEAEALIKRMDDAGDDFEDVYDKAGDWLTLAMKDDESSARSVMDRFNALMEERNKELEGNTESEQKTETTTEVDGDEAFGDD